MEPVNGRAQEESEKIAKLPKLTQFLVQPKQPAVLETSSSSLCPQPSITLAGSDVLGENSNTSNVTHCSVTEKEGARDNENISKMQGLSHFVSSLT